MNRSRQWVGTLLAGAIVLALVAPAAAAQTQLGTLAQGNELSAPNYGSDASAGAMSNQNFNTPESDGRPGAKAYMEGMAAYHRGDLTHAVYMLKVAASWAYAAADYNLGVMYFQGEHVAENRPLGAAWMFIAAERGAQDYVDARHMMVTSLDGAERTQALAYYQQLQKTYGEKVAMRRAKAQWAFAKANQTGTRVGGTVGRLLVGSYDTGGAPVSGQRQMFAAGFGFVQGGSTDGSVAYQQFHQSDNPYNPIFLKDYTGTATVGPLQQVDGSESPSGSAKPVQPAEKPDPAEPAHRGV